MSSEILGKATLSEPIPALDFHFPTLADCTFLLPFRAPPSLLLSSRPFSRPLALHLCLCLELGSYYVAQAGLGFIIFLPQLSEYRDDGSIDTD